MHTHTRKRNTELFTIKQTQMVRLLALGYSHAEIARKLRLTELSLHQYWATLVAKTNCRNRFELLMLAVRKGVVPIPGYKLVKSEEDRTHAI